MEIFNKTFNRHNLFDVSNYNFDRKKKFSDEFIIETMYD